MVEVLIIGMKMATPFDKETDIPKIAQSVLDSLAEDLVAVYDRGGRIVYNWGGEGLLKRYGIHAEDFLDKTLHDILPPKIADERLEKLQRVFDTGEVHREEYEVQLPNGVFWQDIVLSPMVVDNEIVNVIGYIRDITQVKLAEQSRDMAEKRYESFVHNIPIGVYRTTPDGTVVFANQKLIDLLGFDSFDEVSRISLEDENHYSGEMERSHFKELIEKNDKVNGLEVQWKKRDGSVIHVRENATTVRDDDGNVLYYEGTIEDITDRKEIEENLQESRELFRSLVERAYDGICIVQGGNLIYANPRLSEIIGYSQSELLGSDFQNYIFPECRHLVTENYKRRMSGEFVPPIYETRLLHKSGNPIEAELNAGIIIIEGAPADFVFVKDITERKRFENELIESERKYRVLFDNSTEAILMLAMDGTILDADQKACALFDYSKGELLSKKFENLFSVERYREISGRFEEMYSQDYPSESVVLNSKKEPVPVEVALKKVKIGGELRTLAIFHDISRRHNLQKQLRRSQRLEAVGQLAGGIAHDFNNILTALFGYTDILRFSIKGNEEIHGYIDEIEKVATKASSLTQQLLTFSRKQILEPVVLDLNHIVEEMADMLRRLIGEKIEFQHDLGDELPLVMADKGGIEQVIMNLVVNARDAMPEGGEISIETSKVYLDRLDVTSLPGAIPGEYVLLRVSDTGHGIPREIRDRIFDPFFTTKSDIGGTGLGLPTVFGIVKQSGGFLDLVTTEFRGTRFDIYLPAVQGEFEALPKAPSEDIASGSGNILVVEDDPAVRKTILTILKGAGYTAVEAIDGADAIRKVALSAEQFDMVITDIVMPHIDGRELADKLLEANPEVRILYISGYDNISKLPPNWKGRRDDFLQKPFTAAHLTRKIREILDK